MALKKRATSLFDDIFQLQSTVPDIDPEDPEDGFKSGLTEGASEAEVLEATQLRKQAAIIPDDPKYRGKKITRKALHSEDEQDDDGSSDGDEDSNITDGFDEDDEKADEDNDDSDGDFGYDVLEDGMEKEVSGDEEEDAGDEDVSEGGETDDDDEKKDVVVVKPTDASDKEKGRVVSFQVDLWDEIIKCRIAMQKMIASCNRLPTPEYWGRFSTFPSFQKESASAQKSVGKVVSSLLELQEKLLDKLPNQSQSSKSDMDEEITSESEIEDDKDGGKTSQKKNDDLKDLDAEDVAKEGFDDDDECDVGDDGSGDDQEADDQSNDEGMDVVEDTGPISGEKKDRQKGVKRKFNDHEVKHLLAKRHREFQSFRNSTLEKWDEKTRLSSAKIKSKNFAAFDISVLKQIQQVLGNKDRLIKRIHQNRSSVRPFGQAVRDKEKKLIDMVVEDDDDDVEMKQRVVHPEIDVNYEIVDDSDFYQICLRDFIQLKQNEETDPVLANKYWMEIQNMRKKHKRKVDTRASKGRKIRYHVKEKLKNFMAPYDKSIWSDEQKDDLFKALFGGNQDDNSQSNGHEEAPTINIGL